MEIKDSGERKFFPTGAVRDIQEGKGRFDYSDMGVLGHFWSAHTGEEQSIITLLDDYMIFNDREILFTIFNKFIEEVYDNDAATAFLNLAIHYERGASKYSPHNWKKGIPDESFLNSAIRHYLKAVRGDDDEDHKSAFLFNLSGLYYNHVKKKLTMWREEQNNE